MTPRIHLISLPLLVCLALVALAPSSAAHHSFSMYDSEKLLLLDGTVNEFQWTNPHAILWVTGSTAPGQPPELWTVELPTSPGNLGRMGWKRNSLAPGDRVVVELNPLRDGRRGGSFKKATLASSGAVLVATMRDEPPAPAHDEHDEHDPDEHDHEKAGSCALQAGRAGSTGAPWLALFPLVAMGARRARRRLALGT